MRCHSSMTILTIITKFTHYHPNKLYRATTAYCDVSSGRQHAEDFPYPQHTAVMCLNYLSFVAWLLDVGGTVDDMMSQIPVGCHAEVTLPARESFINGFRSGAAAFGS